MCYVEQEMSQFLTEKFARDFGRYHGCTVSLDLAHNHPHHLQQKPKVTNEHSMTISYHLQQKFHKIRRQEKLFIGINELSI